MAYRTDSIEGRFLAGDPEVVPQVNRWVAGVLAAPAFWALRPSWNDMHQEVLGRVVESLRRGRFDPAKSFQAYVQGIARFTGYKAMGRGIRDAADELDEAAVPAEGREEDRLIACQMARRALEVASAECRELIRAYFLDERDYRELAEEAALPVGTVKSRLFRCLRAIQRKFREPGGAPG